MKRKLIGLMCVLAITASFVACGGEKKEDATSKTEIAKDSDTEDKEDKDSKSDKKDEKEKEESEKVDSENEEDEDTEKEKSNNSENPLSKFGYNIKIPKGWNPLPKKEVDLIAGPQLKDFMVGMWAKHPTSGPNFAIMVNDNTAISDLVAYKELMETVLNEIENVSKGVLTDENYGGIDVLKIESVEFNTQKNKFLKVTQNIMEKDGGFIVITLTDDSNENVGLEDFEEMMGTLKKI
ncbi:MAG: hypothetical protein ACRCWG_05875 [Sarcina sp.]